MKFPNWLRRGTFLVALLAGAVPLSAAAQAKDSGAQPELLVFAAASLTDVMERIGTAYTHATGQKVRFSFAASSALARQIEAGARADVFASADIEWMDYLQARSLIERKSRRDLLGNRLVLVAPANSSLRLHIEKGFDLVGALAGGRLATGDPDSVPVGRYARSALTALGVWNDVADRLVRAENVRSALAFVSRGEAPLGIVYETDARIDKGVRVVDTFPENAHLPIIYPVAAIADRKSGSDRFLEFLRSDTARAACVEFGFRPLF
jgi:molybdate transport system substrate-binding protein